MAEIHTDIDRMIMQAQYLLAMNQSPVDTDMTDMERKQYQDQIKELIQTVKTHLDANVTLGEKQKELVRSFAVPRPTRQIVVVTKKGFIRNSILDVLRKEILAAVPKEMLNLQALQYIV